MLAGGREPPVWGGGEKGRCPDWGGGGRGGGVSPGKYVGGEAEGVSLEWGEKGRCTYFQAKGNMGEGKEGDISLGWW